MSEIVLSIVVPCYNKWNFTKACLEDLLKLPADHEIIIIDNASTDETNVELNKMADKLSYNSNSCYKIAYIRNEENLGFAKACNIGYRIALGDNVLFLNNDIRIKKDHSIWTQKLLNQCKENVLVGPTMGQLDEHLNFKQEANKLLIGNSYMSGWCIASNKHNWERLILPNYQGPFSEEFGLAYFEDTDLGFRAQILNFEFSVVDIPVVHFGKQTSKQLNTYELYNKARKVFVEKWKNQSPSFRLSKKH